MANLKVAFAANIEKAGAELLKQALNDYPGCFELVPASDHPEYIFKIAGQSFQMTLPDDEQPVFTPVHGINYASAVDFLTKAETVAKWAQVGDLSNPASGIRDQEIKTELFRIDRPGNFDDNATASEVDWHAPAFFGYEFLSGEWQRPAFRLKITNTGNRSLWVHALYLGCDFKITDQLLPGKELKPGEATWLTTVLNSITSKTIPLQVEEMYLAQGISKIKEFIKLFISTEELPVHRFAQAGLQKDTPATARRGMSRGIQLTAPDWTTREIELITIKPIEETSGAEPEEDTTPELSPPSPAAFPPPKSSSPSVTSKLKNWLKDLTKSKSEKPEAFPSPSNKPGVDKSVFEEDFEKIYPEHADEADEAIPSPKPNRSIKKELDELLTGAEPPETTPTETQLPDALKTEKTGDQVDCSVYAPPEVQKGDDVFIQVWLHLPQLSEQAKAMALEFDDQAGQRAFQSLKIPLEKGDELSLVLEAEGIELDEKVQNLTWNGTLQSAQFVASVPEDYPKNKAIFTLRIFLGEIPAGHIKFILKITEEAVKVSAEPIGNEAKRYKKAFISYSSKDRDEVLKRVQMLDKLGIEFFQDLLSLNPGERWEKKLYENINDSDVFFLFWSTAAKDSKWVLQELEYAINLKHGNEDSPPLIQPVPIEGPPIVSPPEKLGHMHFNDRILYFILKK